MADPRCKCQAAAAQTQSALQSFTSSASKIGDLNVLNSVGAGSIGSGLRTLVSASNSISTGCGSLPTSIGSSLQAGSNWVLNTVGIPPSTIAAVGKLNPIAANLAQGQAEQIFQQVKQGGYKLSDIPGSISSFQNLQRLANNIYPSSANSTATTPIQCTTSPYAEDLIAHAPKYKFLFVVQFVFNDDYQALQNFNFAFVVKKSSRPNAKFAMEDVNYYNFRTKVNTKTEFEEVAMSFHDDISDNALTFYNAYRNALSPITNMDDKTFFSTPEQNGMDFGTAGSVLGKINVTNTQLSYNHYSASRGPLLQDNANIIQEIKLFHVYDYGQMVNVYQFLNPRITSLELDEVDMSVGNEGNEVSIKFNYDTVYIQNAMPITTITDNAGLTPGQDTALYPLRNISTQAQAATTRTPATPQPMPPNCDVPSTINTKS